MMETKRKTQVKEPWLELYLEEEAVEDDKEGKLKIKGGRDKARG